MNLINSHLHAGVYFSLRGRVYSNNSVILITEIGQSNNGLQCVTDRMQCCQYPYGAGQWFYPNGGTVSSYYYYYYAYYYGESFYRTRSDDSSVILYRYNSDIMSPTGLFCCMLPDARGNEQTLCANIG